MNKNFNNNITFGITILGNDVAGLNILSIELEHTSGVISTKKATIRFTEGIGLTNFRTASEEVTRLLLGLKINDKLWIQGYVPTRFADIIESKTNTSGTIYRVVIEDIFSSLLTASLPKTSRSGYKTFETMMIGILKEININEIKEFSFKNKDQVIKQIKPTIYAKKNYADFITSKNNFHKNLKIINSKNQTKEGTDQVSILTALTAKDLIGNTLATNMCCLISDGIGNLRVEKINNDIINPIHKIVIDSKQGSNVVSSPVNNLFQNAAKDGKVILQYRTKNNKNNDTASIQTAVVDNPYGNPHSIGFYTLNEPIDPSSVKQIYNYYINQVSAGRNAIQYEIPATMFASETKELFEINRPVKVHDEFYNIDDVLNILSVTFSYNINSGTTTTLLLQPNTAFVVSDASGSKIKKNLKQKRLLSNINKN